MTRKARIEYVDQFGNWQYFRTVTALGGNVPLALKQALRVQACAGRARAVDEQTGALIDMDMK